MDFYVYLSSDDKQNVEVYFDDFRVKHKLHDIVAGGDYYPFGSVMSGREVTRDDYRFGYQGQFAEKDDETGWNAFELRMYDSEIGRWLSTDPKRIGFSPYIGMGNKPITLIDPDGGGPIQGVDSEGNIVYDDHKGDGNVYLVNEGFTGEIKDLETLQKNSVQIMKDNVFIGTEQQLKTYVLSQLNFADLDANLFIGGIFANISSNTNDIAVGVKLVHEFDDGKVEERGKLTNWTFHIDNKSGSENYLLGDVYSLRNTLEHERFHAIQALRLLHNGPKFYDSESQRKKIAEQSAIIYQINRPSFKKTPYAYKNLVEGYYNKYSKY